MSTLDLSANVPLYGQEQCTWCGAASGQMIRNGYPDPADRLFYTQTFIWNRIQVHNSTDPADLALPVPWATDPHGLTGCLQSLANPAGVHWAEFGDASSSDVLFDMLYWMNVRHYPSAVLINRGGHWVVIVGFVTDVEPVHGSAPVLQTISVYDPEPHNIGTDTQFTGAQWFAGPWNGAIWYAGTWYNQYVAVVEPPIKRGRVRVERVERIGKELLSPDEALESANRWIDELGLAKQAKYRLLAHEEVEALEPVLVREEMPGSEEGAVPHYYIVPFGLRRELDTCGIRMMRVCVLVNAYTGRFEEVTAFGKPVRYLSRDEAVGVVADAMQVEGRELEAADAALIFQPSDITHVRTWPFWRVQVGERVAYVDQWGKLYGKLLPSVPGD
jgi:hypothetical protein